MATSASWFPPSHRWRQTTTVSLTIAQNIVNAINGLATNGQLSLTLRSLAVLPPSDTDQVIPGGIAIELTGNASFIQDRNHRRDGILSVQKSDDDQAW